MFILTVPILFPARNGLVNKVEFLGAYSPKVVRTYEIVKLVINYVALPL